MTGIGNGGADLAVEAGPGVPRRRTRQRSAVVAALGGSQEFLSAQQLHERLGRTGERVGLATVYRALQALTEDGEVDAVRTPDGEVTYRRCSRRHHHHLTCRDCGRTVEIDGSAAEEWVRRMGAANGFTDVDHVIELFGTCGQCRPLTPPAPGHP